MTAESMITNKGYAWEYGHNLQVTPVASALEAMRQVAELAWDVGAKRENWDLTDDDYGKRPIPPTKEQFINDLFKTKEG